MNALIAAEAAGVVSQITHEAVLLPPLLLEHDDAVGRLVEGGGEALPLALQQIDAPLQVHLALRH